MLADRISRNTLVLLTLIGGKNWDTHYLNVNSNIKLKNSGEFYSTQLTCYRGLIMSNISVSIINSRLNTIMFISVLN